MSKVAPTITKGLTTGSAARAADSGGRSLGSKIAGGLAFGAKAAVGAAGLAATIVGGAALKGGITRLLDIENAEAKLKGLGHTTGEVKSIMDNALASVKGTAFGMGEAATTAASAVAAGVKPGKDLTKYLRLTADAATIAGTSLGEMGYIVNKVQASGRAMTEDLNMLQERGIPIFIWLAEEYGVSQTKLRDMVAAGKVDTATFRKVLTENIGGAALESGNTTTGAYKNMMAALSRIAANFLEGVFPKIKLGFQGITDALAPMEEAAAGWGAAFGEGVNRAIAAAQRAGPGILDKLKPIGEAALELGRHIITAVRYAVPGLINIGRALAPLAGAALIAGMKILGPAIEVVGRAIGLIGQHRTTVQIFTVLAVSVFAATRAYAAFKAVLFAARIAQAAYAATLGGLTIAQNSNVVATRAGVAAAYAQKAAAVVVSGATKVWAGAQWLLNAAMSANPIVLVVAAIVALGVAVFIAWKKSETFRRIVTGAFDAVLSAARWLWGWLKKNWPLLLSVLAGPFGLAVALIIKHWGAIKSAVTKAVGAVLGWLREHWKAVLLGLLTGPFGLVLAWVVKKFDLVAKVKHVAEAVYSWLRSNWKTVLVGLLTGPFGAVLAWIVDRFNLVEKVSAQAQRLFGWCRSLGGKIKDAIGDLGHLLYDAGKQIIEGLVSGITDKWEDAKGKVSDIAGDLKDLWPGSPVKAGPLVEWNRTGGPGATIMKLIRRGIERGRPDVKRSMRGVAADMQGGRRGDAGLAGRTGAGSMLDGWRKQMDERVRPALGRLERTSKDVMRRRLPSYARDMGDAVGRMGTRVGDTFANTLPDKAKLMGDRLGKQADRAQGKLQSFGDAIGGKVAPAFGRGVDAIGKQWARVEGKVKTPVRAVVGTVINRGLIGAFNKIAKFVDSPTLSAFSLPAGFREGGYTGRKPAHQVAGVTHGDEFVVKSPSRRRFEYENPGLLDHVNRRGTMRGYRRVHFPGFRGGGYVNPDQRVYMDGEPLSAVHAAQIVLASNLMGTRMGVMQGSWQAPSSYSGTSHTGPGVADTSPGNFHAQAALRRVAVAAWARNIPGAASAGSGAHVHGVSLLSPGARGNSQIASYNAGGDGLGGSDYGPRPGLLPGLTDKLKQFGQLVISGAIGAILAVLPGWAQKIVDEPDKWAKGLLTVPGVSGPFGKMTQALMLKLAAPMAAWAIGKLGSAGGFAGSKATGAAQQYARSLLGRYGWSDSQWGPLQALWQKESGWRWNADNPTSSAYGIPQALPGSKMAAAGADWRTNPQTQIRWGLGYIRGRYGSPSAAWAHSQAHNWYKAGLVGGVFTKPTLIGVGEAGPERVDVTPLGRYAPAGPFAAGRQGPQVLYLDVGEGKRFRMFVRDIADENYADNTEFAATRRRMGATA